MLPLTKDAKRYVALKLIAYWSLEYYRKHHWMELSNLSVGKSSEWLNELEALAYRIKDDETLY